VNTTSFRVPAELVAHLTRVAREQGLSRSEAVRHALELYVARARSSTSTSLVERADELVKGYRGSGVGNLAERSEEHLRKRFRAAGRRPR
jgi:Arc/MetJ-type ribon-helix-helix transcriptional regulator